MITYRFNRKYVREFATEAEAFDHALAYDDNVQATVERDLGRGWEMFTETYDGNGKWVPDPRDEAFYAQLEREAINNLGGIHYQPSGRVIGQNKAGNDIIEYRGWTIYTRTASGRFSICRDGYQSRHNLKDLEAAKAKIDAIVG